MTEQRPTLTDVQAGQGSDVIAQQHRAAEESQALLASIWPRWCADRDLEAESAPVVSEPVYSQVGADLHHAIWVAVLRFEATTRDGQRWHGVVRGPADHPVFKVRPAGRRDRDARSAYALLGEPSNRRGRHHRRAAT